MGRLSSASFGEWLSTAPSTGAQPGAVKAGTVWLRGGKWVGVSGVEGLHASLVVAVERRNRAIGAQAEVVVQRVGEPDTDPVEVDAHTRTVDERGRKGLLDNQGEGIAAVSARVGAEVADVLGRAERGPGLLKQEDCEVSVRGQAAGTDIETVEADFIGGEPHRDV